METIYRSIVVVSVKGPSELLWPFRLGSFGAIFQNSCQAYLAFDFTELGLVDVDKSIGTCHNEKKLNELMRFTSCRL